VRPRDARPAPPARDERTAAAPPRFGARARARLPEREVTSASETDEEPSRLVEVPRHRAEQLLTLAPGVLLTQHSGEGHASSLFLRGFDAGEGQDVEIRVDGVPINDPSNAHGHGYADAGFVIPEAVRRLRFVEGPFDPAQGDFAIAGTADFELGLPEPGVLVTGELGSFGHRRLLLAYRPDDAPADTFVAADVRDTDGFGPNRRATSGAVLAQAARALGGGWRGALGGSAYVADFASAGVVRLDSVRAADAGVTPPPGAGGLRCAPGTEAFFCVADPAQGGASSRFGVTARVERRTRAALLEQSAWVVARRLRIRENFTGNLRDARGDGLDERYQTLSIGTRGRVRITRRLLGRPQTLELGYVGRYVAGDTAMDRVRDGGGAPYARVFETGLALGNVGAYATAIARPAAWLSVRGGVRLDLHALSIERRGLPEGDRAGARLPEESSDALGVAVQPRGTVTLRLLRGLEWIAAAGVGTRSSDAQALSDGERAPFARATAVETGLRLTRGRRGRGAWLDLRGAVFATRLSQDLVFDADRGRNSVVGPSSRYGAVAALRLGVGRALDARGSVSWTEAHLPPPGASGLSLGQGPRLPYVPRIVARADVAWRAEVGVLGQRLRLGAAAGLTVLGARPMPLDRFGQPYALVDASARVGWRAAELALIARNLLDARWRATELEYPSRFGDPAEPASMRPARHVAAGAPLTVIVALTLRTGGAPAESPDDAQGESR
jgi:hypothetical protein